MSPQDAPGYSREHIESALANGPDERIVMLGYSVLMSWIWRIAMNGATLAWMGLIFYLSSLSQAEASRPLETPAIAWLGLLRSYAAHVVLYGILGSMVQASLWGWKPDYRLRWAFAAATFAGLYGISDEYHQSLVFGRSGSVADIVVNFLGATTSASSLYLGVTWWRGRAGKAIERRHVTGLTSP